MQILSAAPAPGASDPPRNPAPGVGRRRPFAMFATGLLAAGCLVVVSCSSVSRVPATGETPPASSEPEPAAEPEIVRETPSPATPSDSQGLTEEEIRALPPEVDSGSDILDISALSLEELKALAPLRDIGFDYDSAELASDARATLQENAEWLSSHPEVRILIEGHCDERGTVEYNLALGEERARVVRDYLGQLGIAGERMRIISYGKEFPLDPAHDENAWRKNRRAHLEIIAK